MVRAVAEAAISHVWAEQVGTQTSVNLIFANHIHHRADGGQIRQINSMYQIEDDSITLALGTISARHPDKPLPYLALLQSGHEGRHKAQVHIGDPPPYSCTSMENGTYIDGRHEVEAWWSAISAFNKLCPGEAISFMIGSQTYTNRQT